MSSDFEWDFENLTHIARHGLTPEEVEYALLHPTLGVAVSAEGGEERIGEVGVTKQGRFLLIWTTLRQDLIRVVTAYDAPRSMVEEYVESRWQ